MGALNPRAETLFHEALERAPEAREAFISTITKDDSCLRREILDLIAAYTEAEAFFDLPVSLCMAEKRVRPKTEEAGDQIGQYKLIEQIGQGGFGTVWVADQEVPLHRRVALKIIKLGMDTNEVIARFDQERQALAMMEHPNIARVLDAGATEHGRPFFVMELVQGTKITEYCDAQELSINQRLELLVQVCHAVQHAHQKGIIHRDLKPSNIIVPLIDELAVPKVIDFGVAKALKGKLSDLTVYTHVEQTVGTPLYMSPEQAEMTSQDIDTRSDIYSLGVLLYELLTGRTPIDQGTVARVGLDEIRRVIREVNPPRPSIRVRSLTGAESTNTARRRQVEPKKLLTLLRGDLDWIVMKCLEKDRKRRYNTASGLALDLQRHLANEVIIARPPTTGYLLSKFIRRNTLAFAASAAIAVALLVGIAASSWQAVRANRALAELRATAPAFAEQARGLAAKEQFDDAISKLDYALRLRPDAAEYLMAKGDLLQCQLKLAEAAAIYREALRVQPGLARAEASAKLCDELLAAPLSEQGRLTYESLSKLHLAMKRQQRPAAEQMPVARLLGEEKKLLVEFWLARLKDRPVSAEVPLENCLAVREDSLLALELGGTKIADLTPLAGLPIGSLNLSGCTGIADLTPLAGLPLRSLVLSGCTGIADLTPLAGLSLDSLDLSGCTRITDFAPLHEFRSLTWLSLRDTGVTDLSPLEGLPLEALGLAGTLIFDIAPLRGMKLKYLSISNTHVADLSPLAGMPLTTLDVSIIPATDYSPLAGAPLENFTILQSRLRDLSFLRDCPLKELALYSCHDARGYAVLAGLKSLKLLILPCTYRELPEEELAAIGTLRDHPNLQSIQSEVTTGRGWSSTNLSKDTFWKIWDRERAFVATLRKSGFEFELTPLTDGTYKLVIQGQPFSDLSIIKGMPISELRLDRTLVSDLAPLAGLPLSILSLDGTPVSDLTPLGAIALKKLSLADTRVTNLSVLRSEPLSSSLEKLWLYRALITDFSPIAACTRLMLLDATDTTLGDLEPVRGRRLKEIYFGSTRVRDISALAGMPLERVFFDNVDVADVAPLLQCPMIEDLIIPEGARNIEALKQLPRLARVSYNYDSKIQRPSTTAAAFWLERERSSLTAETLSFLSEESARAPQDSLLALKVAALQVWFGNDVDYMATCRRAMEVAEQAAINSDAGERAAKSWCLRASNDDDMLKRALVLARKAARVEANVGQRPWYQQTLGMAEFRSGNDEAAAAAFLRAEELAEPDSWNVLLRPFVQGPAQLFRAMILFRNGRTDEAEKLFHEAEANMRPLPENERRLRPTNVIQDQLLYWLVYKEAATIMQIPLLKRVRPAATVLLPPDSEWKWLHPLDGIDPAKDSPGFHTAFYAPDYDDGDWEGGRDSDRVGGGFGYGYAGFNGVDIGTPSTKELGHSAYFRARFTTDKPHSDLELHCLRDDGIIVYLDGKEVARDNMTDGPEAYQLPAARAVSGAEEIAMQRIPLAGVSLPAGQHVMAISLHNPPKPSSDLRIGGITLVEVEVAPSPIK
jgi:serine/threonine protein kinase/Leucine-rich repeat (LRR) protein